MIFMTFGTGLGAGIILNGRLYTGNDMAGNWVIFGFQFRTGGL